MRKVVLLVSLSLLVATLLTSTADALVDGKGCGELDVVFARGSGQSLGQAESVRIRAEIEKRIPVSLAPVFYELGTESYGGHKYPAIDVGNVFNGNPIGAWVSAGYANDYGKSVDAGVGELYNYVVQRNAKCPNARIILGGYSQGAQVIGQTLPKFSAAVQSKIDFVALFGDPKLYLPEGEGLYPPACRGKELSQWRRHIGTCGTDNGALGARKNPYVPATMAAKTGLWCNAADYICGTSKIIGDQAGHGKYKDVGGAIDKAAIEIATRLKKTLPADQSSQIDDSTQMPGTGTTGLDVAFVLDTTGSMYYQIDQTKNFIRSYAQKIKELRGRVSLTLYRDIGDEYTAKIVSNLQSDPAHMLAELDKVFVEGGGDWYEAGNHALMTTFNGLDWQYGATKAAILLTDAPSHNPDQVDGSTIQDVAKRSLEIDPVNVYPVVPGGVQSYYTELAELTTGQVIADEGDTEQALTEAFVKIEQRPTVLLKNMEYAALPGQEVTFDASDTYVIDATIDRYDWDFDGDGVYELTTIDPVANHTYAAAYDGTMQVRVSASNGTIANASAFVKIGTKTQPVLPKAPVNVAANVVSTQGQKSIIDVSWSAADTLATSWSIAVNGVGLGVVESSRLSVQLQDIDRTIDTEISVTAISADQVISESASTTVNMQPASSSENPFMSFQQFLLECIRRLLHSWGLIIGW